MYVNALHTLTVNVTTQMRPAVYHKATLTSLASEMSERGTEKPGTHYKIIVWFCHGSIFSQPIDVTYLYFHNSQCVFTMQRYNKETKAMPLTGK